MNRSAPYLTLNEFARLRCVAREFANCRRVNCQDDGIVGVHFASVHSLLKVVPAKQLTRLTVQSPQNLSDFRATTSLPLCPLLRRLVVLSESETETENVTTPFSVPASVEHIEVDSLAVLLQLHCVAPVCVIVRRHGRDFHFSKPCWCPMRNVQKLVFRSDFYHHGFSWPYLTDLDIRLTWACDGIVLADFLSCAHSVRRIRMRVEIAAEPFHFGPLDTLPSALEELEILMERPESCVSAVPWSDMHLPTGSRFRTLRLAFRTMPKNFQLPNYPWMEVRTWTVPSLPCDDDSQCDSQKPQIYTFGFQVHFLTGSRERETG